MDTTCTAFQDGRYLASGPVGDVALAVKAAAARETTSQILTFDDRTGRVIDFDVRGSDDDVVARLTSAPAQGRAAPAAKTPGRPRLGVVAREVTLLPRHWDWLAGQPGGASVTLRRLVDKARNAGEGASVIREAQQAADRFMAAMLGDQPGYEEVSRALYAGNASRFQELSESWPVDLRDYARRLAAPAFAAEKQAISAGASL
jgi:uncharacterized protein